MSARNKFLIVLGVILAISSTYYFFSTPRGSDLVLVGTVDANQIVVSPQIQGRILKLLVEEGTQVKQGDLIAVLDPVGTGGGGARGRGYDCELAVAGERERIHAEIHQGIDLRRCREFASEPAIGAGAIGAGGSHVDARRERQPAHDWIGEGRSGFRAGTGAGGNESEGAASERAVAEGSGDGSAGEIWIQRLRAPIRQRRRKVRWRQRAHRWRTRSRS